VACVREKTSAHTAFMEKPERKRLVGRPKHACEDNIKKYYLDTSTMHFYYL
jgi:hypothetical protein